MNEADRNTRIFSTELFRHRRGHQQLLFCFRVMTQRDVLNRGLDCSLGPRRGAGVIPLRIFTKVPLNLSTKSVPFLLTANIPLIRDIWSLSRNNRN